MKRRFSGSALFKIPTFVLVFKSSSIFSSSSIVFFKSAINMFISCSSSNFNSFNFFLSSNFLDSFDLMNDFFYQSPNLIGIFSISFYYFLSLFSQSIKYHPFCNNIIVNAIFISIFCITNVLSNWSFV